MQKNIKPVLEAVLLTAGEPVEIGKLAKFLKVKKEQLEQEIDKIIKMYQDEESGLQIILFDGKIQLVSKPELADDIAKFLNLSLNEPISGSLLEVLAIVAYRGPITRAGVQEIRGTDCSFQLRALAMRGLVGKKENPDGSRAYLYQASDDFLKSLGMDKIEKLPDFTKLQKNIEQTQDN